MISLEERLVYCNEFFAVINKIPGEVCSSEEGKIDSRYYIPEVFKELLQNKLSKKIEVIECVNRIDRPVSGLVLLALSEESNSFLKSLFNVKEKVIKKYWAIVEGVLPISKEPVSLKDFMYFTTNKQKSYICEKTHRKSKYAELSYLVKGNGERYSYIEVQLVTGRSHQIRSQLANSGLHIRGDLKYGAKRSDTLPGIRLHSAHLEFTYENGKKYSFDASVPEVDPLWTDAINTLNSVYTGKNSAGEKSE